MRWDWSVPRQTVAAVLNRAGPLDYRVRPRLRTHAAVLIPIVRARRGACEAEDVALAMKQLTEALYGQADMLLVEMPKPSKSCWPSSTPAAHPAASDPGGPAGNQDSPARPPVPLRSAPWAPCPAHGAERAPDRPPPLRRASPGRHPNTAIGTARETARNTNAPVVGVPGHRKPPCRSPGRTQEHDNT